MKYPIEIPTDKKLHPADPSTVAMDPRTTVLARVWHWAQAAPHQTFLIDIDGGSRSYLQVRDDILRWCTVLGEHGVKRGDHVVSLLPQSIDACLIWLATAALGAIAVPVNRELRGEFLRHVLNDAAPTLIFARPEDGPLLDTVPDMRDVPCILLPRGHELQAAGVAADSIAMPQPEDIAVVIYTSGTTGPAKGALVRWAQIAAMITRIPAEYLSAQDVTYAPWPIFHVTGFSPLVTMAYVGGTVVFREKLSVSHFWSDVRRYRCTIATLATAMPLLLAQPPQPDDGNNPLRFVFTIGGAMNVDFKRRFGGCLIGAYGSTELGFPLVNIDVDAATVNVAGYLRDGYLARLCDGSDNGNDVAKGEPGELWVRPPHAAMIFAAYLNRPDATAAAVVDGWYRTGDLMRQREDGAFVFVDRMRDTIRRFGENISSTAMEYVVAEEPEVVECCVFGIASPICGQEVVLTVRVREGDFDPAAFYRRLQPKLPKHMLPSYIAVVDEFPKTPTNKILKNVVAANFTKTSGWQSPVAIK